MRILIIDTYYPKALKAIRKNQPTLQSVSYDKQLSYLLSQHFGTGDAYSHYLNKLGIKAKEIIANDEVLQKTWAKEHNVKIPSDSIFSPLQSLPYLYRYIGRPGWMQNIVLAQIDHFHPDILYCQDLSIINPRNLEYLSKRLKLVGQIASLPPPFKYLRHFNLLLSSLPNLVSEFNNMGIKSRLFKIGFDPRVLKKIGVCKRIYNDVFIGSFSPYHRKGTKLLETVAKDIPVQIWGTGQHFLTPVSSLRRHFHGEVWGLSMYEILASAKIVINRHSDISGEYANNMRMYEASGMGALLLTEERKNLPELFKPGKEVVTYKNSTDLSQKLQYYLKHDDERKKIAQAGQRRTLNEHTYKHRMVELVKILNNSIK